MPEANEPNMTNSTETSRTSTIIKATDRNRGVHGIAFQFDDMNQHADRYLEGIRGEARKILGQAAEQARILKQKAEADGRAAGERAIAEMVERKVAEQMKTVLPALRTAIDEIQRAKPGWLARWESGAVHLATRIAARILRRELAADPQVPLPLVREGLELARGRSEIRLLLNPTDHAALGKQIDALVAELARTGSVAVLADPKIEPGGCRVETRHGAIDQQFEAQLARIEDELSG